MGLDAFVRCNCFREGKAKEPPFPRELVIVDDEGYWDLAVPWEGNEAMHDAFQTWSEHACAHEWMHFARERVCNWAGRELFLQALHQLGPEQFSVLWNELPAGNGGNLTPDLAALALKELKEFQAQAESGTVVELLEVGTGIVIGKGIGPLVLQRNQTVSLTPDGVALSNDAGLLFKARHLMQRQLNNDEYQWRNEETGHDVTTTISLRIYSGELEVDRGRLVERAIVQQRPLNAADLQYIIEPLTRLFGASIETGNPVVWT